MCSAVDSFAYNSIRRHLQSLPNSTGPNLVEFLKHQCMKSSTLCIYFRRSPHSTFVKYVVNFDQARLLVPRRPRAVAIWRGRFAVSTRSLSPAARLCSNPVNGDYGKWEMAKFDPSQNQNPFTG